MKKEGFERLMAEVKERGFTEEVEWAQGVGEPKDAFAMFCEYVWVVLNSGMRYTVAVKIRDRVWGALGEGRPVKEVFGHPGKGAAIQLGWDDKMHEWYDGFLEAEDKVEFLGTLPWIGKITKYHLARNLGVDCCKPDRHLERIAREYGTTPEALCRELAEETGMRVGAVDAVLWRAAEQRLL